MTDLKRIKSAFSSEHWKWSYLTPEEGEKNLLPLLNKNLPHIKPAEWPERFAFGGIFVNGVPAKKDFELPFPCKIEYYEPKFQINKAEDFFPRFQKECILFEDDYLVVCYKPSGLPTMAGREQQIYNLKTYLESYLGVLIHVPSRLDTSTEGVIVVSKHPEMHNPLQNIFQKRKIEKFYIFETEGKFETGKRIVDTFISEHPLHPVLRTSNEFKIPNISAKKAVTNFLLLGKSLFETENGEKIKTSIIEAQPQTGRTHQIRVHARAISCPIIGDNFYDGLPAPALHLVSHRLKFIHPKTSELIDIKAPDRLLPDWMRSLMGSAVSRPPS